MCYNGFVCVLLASSFFVCFVVDPTSIMGDQGHEFAQSAWAFPCKASPSYVCCACIVVIDTPMPIIVVAGWVMLWYSQCPHDALVAFVGKTTLWLQGWLPWPSSSRLRGLSHERFGASRWWHWSRPSQSVMALTASIAIGVVAVTCCCLSQLRLALTLTSRSQLCFLLVD